MPKLYDRLIERAERGTLRGHMPGHKGVPLLGVPAERIDFTELDDTGNLYDLDDNVIREAERDAALAAGADWCAYSAGGSTLLIQGMLGVAARRAASKQRPLRILAARDAHRSFFSAMALLGGDADFIYPHYNDTWNVSEGISADDVRAALAAGDYDAVYITSPTYYGVMSDLAAVSAACADASTLLLVDAAHGAHLVFDKELFGIDRRCEYIMSLSAHKTLGALGGSAFALGNADKAALLQSMQLFGSSSPSYVILASLDKAIADAASAAGRAALAACAERTAALRERVSRIPGVSALGAHGLDPAPLPIAPQSAHAAASAAEASSDHAACSDAAAHSTNKHAAAKCVSRATRTCGAPLDPTRFVFTIDGADGHAVAEWLEAERGVVAEMADSCNVVFIMTAQDTAADFVRLESAIADCAEALVRRVEKPPRDTAPPRPERVASLRTALLSPTETVVLRDAAARIAAESIAPYPPGVPIIAPGEKISQKTIAFFQAIGYNVDKRVCVLASETSKREDIL